MGVKTQTFIQSRDLHEGNPAIPPSELLIWLLENPIAPHPAAGFSFELR